MELANRVVMPAIDMNLCDDGAITDAEVVRHRPGRAALLTGLDPDCVVAAPRCHS